MSSTVYLTAEGLQKLKDDLHHARTVERQKISEEIAEARAQGDLSENAEYDAAKEAQGHLEARIVKMENALASARVVNEDEVDASKARILSNVRVMNQKAKREATYTLVAAQEADLKRNRISVESPIGKALLGREVGETVAVRVPAGTVQLEILDITR
ncbi:transcription elongation factor GreA [Rubrivirga sp. SAORIC476]|uniref:transcription elongation factor GreA n=1 Tax=Rubrivirga sp. SAORIC476 TaxID=1961794 RepID=UPI000BA92DF3|nr:transcription elongation factor GreA [Rubrivirga sp. SAORIC476]MAQ93926.1 transcription elongation factor GreA [Rhodothermaceae bacterium]MBC14712.1 transcription elongation factor GreA [Rhodothermaceae bacterium]PAP80376.1 transcription elongation factor GreA [Rubrivirga sp. SAORIC476]|tara:strand:+ start:286 stop:759 length:474 start_codon:yes stop_codon:yes gene_type:complete